MEAGLIGVDSVYVEINRVKVSTVKSVNASTYMKVCFRAFEAASFLVFGLTTVNMLPLMGIVSFVGL